MKAADGNYAIAAKALEMNEQVLRVRVAQDAQLKAVWSRDASATQVPNEAELMQRELPPDTPPMLPDKVEDNTMAEAIMATDRRILREGLQTAGIQVSTIEKLGLMEGFALNTARFLGASLDLTHRITVFQGVSLFEQAEFIKKTYLEDASLPHELKIEWTKCYAEISDLIGKSSDRVLAGTQAAVAMMRKKEGEGDKGGKRKLGFQPLKRASQQQTTEEPQGGGGGGQG